MDEFVENFDGKLILIPSPEELVYFYPTIPQPPMDETTDDIWLFEHEGVEFASNPCFLDINGIRCCFTSQDITGPLVQDMLVTNQDQKRSQNRDVQTKINKSHEAMHFITEIP